MISNNSAQTTPVRVSTANGVMIAKRLKEKTHNYKKLITTVLQWTGGQPFLTQKLCKLIVAAERLSRKWR